MSIVLDGTTGITSPSVNAGNIVGQVCFFGMTTAPAGFLKANGAAVSRTTYADLFAAIGTTFGAGDGSTTFALPDLRGEFPRGWDDGRGVDSGRAFGSAQADQFQSHLHNSHMRSSATFTGSEGFIGANSSGGTTVGMGFQDQYTATGGSGGAPRAGSETRPRNVALLACIKY